MTSCQPTEVEQFAIEAKLNLILGAEAYDRVFHGLDCPDRAERAGSTGQHSGAPNEI